MFRVEELNLFVADKDSVARSEMRRTLLSLAPRSRVVESATAAHALKTLQESQFDCAFFAGRFDDSGATEMIRALRGYGIDTPIVVVTSPGDRTNAAELMLAGASQTLPRDAVSSETILRSLATTIPLSRVERAKEQSERLRLLAEDRVKLLAEAGVTLGASLDFEETLSNIARLAVPRFADLCVIDMVEGDVIRRVAVAHAEPGLEATAQDLKKFPPDPRGTHPAAVAIQTGRSQFSSGAPVDFISRHATSSRHREIVRTLDYKSYIATPLISRDKILGAVSFVQTSDRTPYGDTDVLVAEELARRAAQAVDNARLFATAVDERKELEASEARYRFLADSIPNIVWTASRDGDNTYVNRQWIEFTGLSLEQSAGRGWFDAIHPDDRRQSERFWQAALDGGVSFETEFRIRSGIDGGYRWHLTRALPQVDADGRTLLWFGTSTDIDGQKRSAELQQFLVDASAILASSLDFEGTLTQIANLSVPHIADWCAIDLLEGEGIRRVAVAHADPAKIDLAHEMYRRYPPNLRESTGVGAVLQSGQAALVREITPEMLEASVPDPEQRSVLLSLGLRSYICAPIRVRTETLGALTFIAAESGRLYDDADLAIATEIAYRIGLALDNARLFQEMREQARREEFINSIAKKLRASLDAGEILRTALAEIGRAFEVSRASWLRINHERGTLEIAPQQWCAPGVEPLLRSYPFSSIPEGVLATYRRGEPVAIKNLLSDPRTAGFFAGTGLPPGAQAMLGCPVFMRGELSGIVTITDVQSERDWSTADIDTLTAICTTLTLALENARIYAREHRVADMLQTAFLANIPRRLPGLSVDSIYRAGLEEAQVGGDFYDAFTLPDGRVAVVMADVSGKGLSAAVQTATVKYSLRAFAAEAAAPSLVLTRLSRMLRADPVGLGDHFVTIFYAVFDPASGRIAYSNAGHETQVIKRRTGGTTLLNATGPILGINEQRYEQSTDYLAPGDSLILFTDGLTEARSKKRELLEMPRVAAAIDRIPAEASATVIVKRLERLAMTWAENRPQDDLAILVVRNDADGTDTGVDEHDLASGSLPLQPGDNLELLFDFEFQSLPDYAGEVRQAVGHWMGALGFDRAAIEDFQTAATEAVTNAVRHGSPQGAEDLILVRGYRSSADAFIIEVGDRGPGLRNPQVDPQMPSPEATGGRGLPFMQLLADNVDYVSSATMHWVRLVKRPTAGS